VSVSLFLVWLLIALNSTAQRAYAYVDPGSGLFLLQVVGTTFAGMTFLLRKKISDLFGWFGKRPAKADEDLAQR
jgi:hypothetical protein